MALLRTVVPLLGILALALTSGRAGAEASCSDPDVLRIEGAGQTVKWNYTPPGRQDRYGHAEALVNAPMAKVRAQTVDFAHFKDLVPDKFHTARVIAKEKGSTDVYVQVPVMRGLIVLTTVLRFGPPRVVSPGLELVEGTFVSGNKNVKTANILFTVHEIDAEHTVLKCDLLILPTMAAPQSAIDEELRDAAQQAIDAMQERAQGRKGTFPINPQKPQATGNP